MSPTTISSLVFPLIVLLVYQVNGFPTGAPKETCTHGNVIHRSRASNHTEFYEPLPASENPFVFHCVLEKYRPGHSLRVTISGTNSETFNGFFLQARKVNGTTPIGTFSDLPALTKPIQCSGAVDDSVTHTSRDPKEALSFLWKAPDQCQGDIVFIGSVALGHSHFYSDMRSSIIEADMATCGVGIIQVNFIAMVIGLMFAMAFLTSQ